jgi:hypothetical protein
MFSKHHLKSYEKNQINIFLFTDYSLAIMLNLFYRDAVMSTPYSRKKKFPTHTTHFI